MSTNLNPKQELFLAYLFDRGSEHRGDPYGAAEAAGYSTRSVPDLLRRLRDEIRNRTFDTLSGASIKAAMQVIDSLDEDGEVPKGDIRLKAAESILDRIGVGKQQSIDITSNDESISPLFILPAKAEVEVDEDYDGIELDKDA